MIGDITVTASGRTVEESTSILHKAEFRILPAPRKEAWEQTGKAASTDNEPRGSKHCCPTRPAAANRTDDSRKSEIDFEKEVRLRSQNRETAARK